MLIRDESQQNAELKQAFVNHLPRRVEMVQKRAARICKNAFDINAISQLSQEVQNLAGACGRYGLISHSERFYTVEKLLESILTDARELSLEQRNSLEEMAARLTIEPVAQAKVIHNVSSFVQTPDTTLGGSRWQVPPDEYWKRFSAEIVVAIDSEGPYASLTATALTVVQSTPEPDSVVQFDDLVIDSQDFDSNFGFGEPLRPTEKVETEDFQTQVVEARVVESPFGLSRAPLLEPLRDELEIEVESPRLYEAESNGPAWLPIVEDRPSLDLAVNQGSKAPKTRAAYVWQQSKNDSEALQVGLSTLGFSVEFFHTYEDLCAALKEAQTNLVILRPEQKLDFDNLGDGLIAFKQRGLSCTVVGFAESNDLTGRIRAMRAGIDLLLPRSASAEEVCLRIANSPAVEQVSDFRVMIVEDDRSQALFAESVLRKVGMQTAVVMDPLLTLNELERFRPDIILMDLYMPGINGIELTAIVREREEFLTTPIVFLSGEQDSDKQLDALSAGGDDFLSKPIRPKHLIAAVTNRAKRAREQAKKLLSAAPNSATTEVVSGLQPRARVLDQLSNVLVAESRNEIQGAVVFFEIQDASALRAEVGLSGLDVVTAELGKKIADTLQPEEWLCRYGDASMLLLSQTRSLTALVEFAQQTVTLSALKSLSVDGKVVHIKVAAGLCGFSEDIFDAKGMINGAERALSQARLKGEWVAAFEPVPLVPKGEAEMMADAVLDALKEDSFQILYQPIIELDSSGYEQFEVIVRLRTAKGQVYSGAQLVANSTQHGLMAEVDRWVLGRCMALQDQRKRKNDATLRLFVSQSFDSLIDPQRIAWLRQSIETRRILASSIALEFKMSDILQDLRASVLFFQQAHAIGVKLVLDEFESSLSAMQLLSYLPVDYLKLSQKYFNSGVQNFAGELKAAISAAHDGGRKVIASRVENAQTASTLWSLGVDFIQGNFVQQPVADLNYDFKSSGL